MRRLLALIAALALAFAVFPVALAQDSPGTLPELAIDTDRGQDTGAINLSLEPGDRETIEIRFSVNAESPVEAETYLADAIAPPNGGFGLGPPDELKLEPATWIAFDAETLTLEPGDPVDRTLTVTVPDNAAPGQYVAALAVQTVDPVLLTSDGDIGQIVRAVAVIAIEVPGEVEAGFELGEPALVQQPTGASIQVPIANTGNVPVYPQGTLTLESPTGDEVVAMPVTMGSVFAGGNTYLDLSLADPPPAGEYRLSLSLTDPDTGETAAVVDAPVTAPEVAASPDDAEPAALVAFGDISIEPEGTPVEAVLVSVEVANFGPPVAGAILTLEVSRDGQIVERAIIAEGVSLVDGVTGISTSYTPEGGFVSGEWTFRVTLESADADGVVTLIIQSDTVGSVDIP